MVPVDVLHESCEFSMSGLLVSWDSAGTMMPYLCDVAFGKKGLWLG